MTTPPTPNDRITENSEAIEQSSGPAGSLLLKIAAGTIVLVAAAFLVMYNIGEIDPEAIYQQAREAGPYGLALYFSLYIITSGLVLPIPMFLIGCGALLGVGPGFIAGMVATTAAAVVGYFYGKVLFNEPLRRRFPKVAARLDRFGDQVEFRFIFFCRLFTIANTPLHYACGIKGVGLPTYIGATFFGGMPLAFLLVYTGGNFLELYRSITDRGLGHPVVAVFIGILLITAGGPYIMRKILRFNL